LLLFLPVQEKQSQQKSPEPEQPPYVETGQRQFSFYPGGKLLIENLVPGDVKVIGWGRASVMVQSERVFYHLKPDQARLLASEYPIQLRYTETSGTVRTDGPPKSNATLEANLTIYVPKEKTDLTIRLLMGDLAVGALNGWVEATLNEGNVEAKSLSGYFSALTQHGDIEVEMSGKRWTGHEFSASTKKGNIRLVLPVDYSAALFLETRDGKMEIEYPEQKVEGEDTPLRMVSKKNAHSLTAAVGGGGAPVKLLTSSGDVKLSAQK
jgi:DUF4097 and DUF4098 domain-containing protein YvlB